MDEQRFARALQGNHAGGYWDKGKINPVMTVRNAHGENCGKKVSAVSFLFSGEGKDADVLGFAEERCEECDELVGVEVGSKRDCLRRIGRWVSPPLLKSWLLLTVYDSIVKFWDLRAQLASTRRIYVSESVSQTLDRTADRGKRSRGVVSLVEAKGNIYAMCNDAR